MRIRNFLHKGLGRLYDGEGSKGVPASAAGKIEDMFAFLDGMGTEEELRRLPYWKPHELTGNRKGTWSLAVTKNWRLIFWINKTEAEICDVNLEDYH